jgi:hypothetical protein
VCLSVYVVDFNTVLNFCVCVCVRACVCVCVRARARVCVRRLSNMFRFSKLHFVSHLILFRVHYTIICICSCTPTKSSFNSETRLLEGSLLGTSLHHQNTSDSRLVCLKYLSVHWLLSVPCCHTTIPQLLLQIHFNIHTGLQFNSRSS